jgi:hypothetical protein
VRKFGSVSKNSLAEDGVRPDFLRLKDEVGALIDLVEMHCGHRWSEHPATARVLQLAIDALLARYGAHEDLKFARALGEMRRVLRPAGRLMFVEHGRAPDPNVVWWQDRLTPAWKRIGGGCHLAR